MILELDAGNSAVKWRVLDPGGAIVRRGKVMWAHAIQLKDLQGAGLLRARLSCVAGEKLAQELMAVLVDSLGIETERARPLLECDGLRVAYSDPSRLGVDRWLAMLAAHRLSAHGCCVIDCGSAVTADLVDAGGKHMGGYIVSGLHAQVNALLAATGDIVLAGNAARQAKMPDTDWGVDTETAVWRGAARMLKSFLDEIIDEVRANNPAARIFVTGGDGQMLLASAIEAGDVSWRQDLVMEGLHIALP